MAFYARLGLEVQNRHFDGEVLAWPFLATPTADRRAAGARLMIAAADGPIDASKQPMLFDCWIDDARTMARSCSPASSTPARPGRAHLPQTSERRTRTSSSPAPRYEPRITAQARMRHSSSPAAANPASRRSVTSRRIR
jgi:hypothetical protein